MTHLNDEKKIKTIMIKKMLVSRKANEEMLKVVPHRGFLDLAIIYTISDGIVAKVVKDESVLTEEQLYHRSTIDRPVLKNMAEVMHDIAGLTIEESPLWVGTNDKKVYGANCILDLGFMDEVATRLKGSFYILPSSVHEVLFIGEDILPPENLREIVCTVNIKEVSAKDKLSDSVYYYDADTREITFAGGIV